MQVLEFLFASWVGVVVSEKMTYMARALSRSLYCRHIVNAVHQMPLADETFVFIYSNWFCSMFPRALWRVACVSFVRVLAQKGTCISLRLFC